MALEMTLASTPLGQGANLIVVEFIYSGSTGVTVTLSDFAQYLVQINVGSGATYADIATALAGATGCPVQSTFATANGADASVTGTFVGMAGATDGQGAGQFYSGFSRRKHYITPQYIKRRAGSLGY